MLELWLVRHGETDWNAEHRIQGHLDTTLSEKGKEQADLLAKRLSCLKEKHNITFDEVYSSDLKRAFNTAEACFPQGNGCQTKIIKELRLREINLGDMQGKRWPDLTPEETKQMSVWLRGPYNRKIPGGESSDDITARVKEWLESLPDKGRIIAFSHGGAIAKILYLFTGRPPYNNETEEVELVDYSQNKDGRITCPWKFRLGNTSISKVMFGPTFSTVSVVNDTAHLE